MAGESGTCRVGCLSAFLDGCLAACVREGWYMALFCRPGGGEMEVIASPLWRATSSVLGVRGFVVQPFCGVRRLIVADLYMRLRGHTISWRCNTRLPTFFRELFRHVVTTRLSLTLVGDRSSAPLDRTAYGAAVSAGVRAIRSGLFQKVVLSRVRRVPLPEHFSYGASFVLMCARHAKAFNYLLYLHSGALWMGASPEPLVKICNNTLRMRALAATRRLPANDAAVLWSQKDKHEQQLVTQHIVSCLTRAHITHSVSAPRTHALKDMAHLATDFSVRLTPEYLARVDNLLLALHPTPAVCGSPTLPAQRFISAQEAHHRGYYAGYLGPVGIGSTLDLYVNIRCARCWQNTAQLYAGAGIVAASDPRAEWTETEMKMDTMAAILSCAGG